MGVMIKRRFCACRKSAAISLARWGKGGARKQINQPMGTPRRRAAFWVTCDGDAPEGADANEGAANEGAATEGADANEGDVTEGVVVPVGEPLHLLRLAAMGVQATGLALGTRQIAKIIAT